MEVPEGPAWAHHGGLVNGEERNGATQEHLCPCARVSMTLLFVSSFSSDFVGDVIYFSFG